MVNARHVALAVASGLAIHLTTLAGPTRLHAQGATTQGATTQGASMEGVMGVRPTTTRLGGHVGFVVPVVRRGNGVTSDVSDRFIYGFPVGLTVKPRGPVAVDFEFIPTFGTGDDFVLTIHPGVVYGFGGHYALGARAAYDAGSSNDSYGITPLISRGFRIGRTTGWFAEVDLPIRRNQPSGGARFTSIALAGHLGLSF
ncbi:MAG TPA: hypothetical protein VEZ47_00585 [Gemmatirosa sp.]|jgi:hypothetical protein|nr:hypothetical protein [Gemmatirosa sp.]